MENDHFIHAYVVTFYDAPPSKTPRRFRFDGHYRDEGEKRIRKFLNRENISRQLDAADIGWLVCATTKPSSIVCMADSDEKLALLRLLIRSDMALYTMDQVMEQKRLQRERHVEQNERHEMGALPTRIAALQDRLSELQNKYP